MTSAGNDAKPNHMGRRELLAAASILPIVVTVASSVRSAQGASPCPSSSTLDQVKKRGKIVVGINPAQAPYGLLGNNGQWTGFDPHLARETANRLGVKLEITQVTPSSRIPLLFAGKVDALMAGMAVTRRRMLQIDFSIPYITVDEKLLVKQGSGISGPVDLAGRTVAVVAGSSTEVALQKAQPKAKLLRYQELPDGFLALKRGLADAFASDVMIITKLAATDTQQKYEIVGPDLDVIPIAVGVRPIDSRWRDTMTFTLLDMQKDGTYAKLFDEYFGKNSQFHLPVPALDLQGMPD
ncbi:MAG TPA: transporter substrate-binding domain-containing protein [bacterium]|nr:transporter substrate-binding domain-containing protein [bacterium]